MAFAFFSVGAEEAGAFFEVLSAPEELSLFEASAFSDVPEDEAAEVPEAPSEDDAAEDEAAPPEEEA